MQEVHQGYPQHRWIAIGHMGEAADEALKKYPKLADEIRKHRLKYMVNVDYEVPIMDLIEKANKLAGDLSEAQRAAHKCGSVAVSLLKPGTKRYEKWLSLRNNRRRATMRKNQQEGQMAFSVTNLQTGETTTSEDVARRQESRMGFLADAERKRGLRESAQEILFWSDQHRPQDYENCVLNVPTEKVDRVVEALQGGENLSQMRGWANCRICDENLGSSDLGGHGFVWPELAEHYIIEHGVWSPDLNKLADQLLSEDAELEEDGIEEDHGTEGKEAGKHCGVFIPLPYSLAKDFPDKSEHDTSVPHYTVLYMGELTPKQYKVFCNLVRVFAQKIKPFECDTESYGEFLNAEGKKIPHMRPTARSATKMALLHATLRQHIENFSHEIGAKVGHSYGHMGGPSPMVPYEIQFKAHATLGYIQPMAPYTGPKPTGAWRVTELECWGHERICCALGKTKIDQPTGLTREPLAGAYPRAVPDAFAEGRLSESGDLPSGQRERRRIYRVTRPSDLPHRSILDQDPHASDVEINNYADSFSKDRRREAQSLTTAAKRAWQARPGYADAVAQTKAGHARRESGKADRAKKMGIPRKPQLSDVMSDLSRYMPEDKIPGGLADKASPREFDPKALAKGIKVELEHASSVKIAQEIAMDHLSEDPLYYEKLAKMEKTHEDVIGGGSSTGDIGLAGSLPYQSVLQKAKNKLDRKRLEGLTK